MEHKQNYNWPHKQICYLHKKNNKEDKDSFQIIHYFIISTYKKRYSKISLKITIHKTLPWNMNNKETQTNFKINCNVISDKKEQDSNKVIY